MASLRRRIDSVFGTPHEHAIKEGGYHAETVPFATQGAGARSVETRNVEPSEDDDLEQVVMAIDIKESGTVGCSYYVAAEETLHILADVQHGGVEILEICECSFTKVSVSSRLNTWISVSEARDQTNDCSQLDSRR